METRKFGKGYWKTFRQGIEREWVITNGIGGYAGSSIIGAHTRKHHGLLIASLRPPTQRYMALSKIREHIEVNGEQFCLSADQRTGGVLEEGQRYLQRFLYKELPQFIYQVNDIYIEKTIGLAYGKNTAAIAYEIQNGMHESKFRFVPLFNFRDHNNGSRCEELKFDVRRQGRELTLIPKNEEGNTAIRFYAGAGEYRERDTVFDKGLELQTEIDTGMSSQDNNFTPYEVILTLRPFEKRKVSFICSLEEEFEKDAFAVIDASRERAAALVEQAGLHDVFGDALVQAADQFIADRKSTGYKTILAGLPWFTDWGRDTMIAMQGLTLVTKRFEDARGILKTFSKYVRNGLVPNMFPDEGLEPLYNTADASLWYFYSVYKYLEYTGGEEDYEFVKKEIYPSLKEILEHYEKGAGFSIYMDSDCLIHAGGGFDQVTWMDVRVGEWVVTPRHGKPVEINALWYNALKIMEGLADRFEGAGEQYGSLAEKVKRSFRSRFWNEQAGCLYDVVDEEVMGTEQIRDNAQVRPNQIWAVSLPFAVLPGEQERSVVHTVLEQLYAGYGLRSLSPRDAEYRGSYFGELHDRDAAYHQGTVWAFPLGGLITAFVKVYDHSPESISFAEKLIRPLEDHLMDGCIGSIAEIFDGDEPHVSRGCYAQAWSVGEILRAYAEDILQR